MKGNVIFVTPWFWSHGDMKGMPTIYQTAKGFIRKGYKVFVVIGANTCNKEFIYKGIHVHQVKVNSFKKTCKYDFFKSPFECKLNFIGRLLWQVEKLWWAEKIKSSVDKIIKSGSGAFTILYLVSPLSILAISNHFLQIPQVWRFMGVNVSFSGGFVRNALKHPIEFLSLLRIRNFSQIVKPVIVVTDDGTQGDKVINKLGITYSKLLFLKNGIEDSRKTICDFSLDTNFSFRKSLHSRLKELKRKKNVMVVISLNRLAPWKHVDKVVYIADLLKRIGKIENYRFLILNEGPMFESIKKDIKRLELDNYVYMIGSVARNELKCWLEVSDVYISMMDYSQLGNTTYEAALYGLVLLLRADQKTAEFFKDGDEALLVSDVKEAVDSLLKVYEDIDFKKKLIENARKRIMETLPTWEERINQEIEEIERTYAISS